jgi:hypothetical protein
MNDTNTLTKKEIAGRWNCSTRTVERDVKRFGLVPADFIGHQPVFDLPALERMETRRRDYKMKKAGYHQNGKETILTVKEAKRLARKGAR